MGETFSVLVVTGMAREAKILAGPGVRVIHAGGNPARLRKLLGTHGHPNAAAVISFGIAGGLHPSLEPGDVLVATGLVDGEERMAADEGLVEHLGHALAAGGLHPVFADLLGVDEAVADCDHKAELHALTGAAAVDMESHVAITYAAHHDLPFAAVRVICDPATRSLPKVAADALRPDGKVDGFGLLRGLVRRPAQLVGLMQLAGDARTSFRALNRCKDLLGLGLGLGRQA